jgi:hypothetical protein
MVEGVPDVPRFIWGVWKCEPFFELAREGWRLIRYSDIGDVHAGIMKIGEIIR